MRAEFLEKRTMCSGDIRITESGGAFVLRGDSHDNIVQVIQDRSGHLVVSASSGTTINGKAESFASTSVPKSLQIDLGAGNDVLLLDRLRLDGDVLIQPRRGEDSIVVRRSNIGGRLFLDDTNGPSDIAIRDTIVGGKLRVTTAFRTDAVSITNSVVYGTSLITTGAGDDHIRIAGSEFRRATALDPGAGEDEVYREVVTRYDFRRGAFGWTHAFARYPAGQVVGYDAQGRPITAEVAYELSGGYVSPAAEVGTSGAHRLSGRNNSDQLLMFVYRPLRTVEGILPDSQYTAEFGVDLATTFYYESSRRLAVGALPDKPVVAPTPDPIAPNGGIYPDGVYLLGSDGKVILPPQINGAGDIHYTTNDGTEPPYSQAYGKVSYHHVMRDPLRSSEKGEFWPIVGIGSAFEGRATIYLLKISVILKPVEPWRG